MADQEKKAAAAPEEKKNKPAVVVVDYHGRRPVRMDLDMHHPGADAFQLLPGKRELPWVVFKLFASTALGKKYLFDGSAMMNGFGVEIVGTRQTAKAEVVRMRHSAGLRLIYSDDEIPPEEDMIDEGLKTRAREDQLTQAIQGGASRIDLGKINAEETPEKMRQLAEQNLQSESYSGRR